MKWACTFDVWDETRRDPEKECATYVNSPIEWEPEPESEYRWTWRFYVEADTYPAAERKAWEKFSSQKLPHWAELTRVQIEIEREKTE